MKHLEHWLIWQLKHTETMCKVIPDGTSGEAPGSDEGGIRSSSERCGREDAEAFNAPRAGNSSCRNGRCLHSRRWSVNRVCRFNAALVTRRSRFQSARFLGRLVREPDAATKVQLALLVTFALLLTAFLFKLARVASVAFVACTRLWARAASSASEAGACDSMWGGGSGCSLGAGGDCGAGTASLRASGGFGNGAAGLSSSPSTSLRSKAKLDESPGGVPIVNLLGPLVQRRY